MSRELIQAGLPLVTWLLAHSSTREGGRESIRVPRSCIQVLRCQKDPGVEMEGVKGNGQGTPFCAQP